MTPSGKHVWALISELDQPKQDGVGGCYMNEQDMSAQLGLDADSVSDLRRDHLRWALLHKEDVEGLRGAYWFPRLPPGIEPAPPPEIKALPPRRRTQALRDWLTGQATALDRFIDTREGRTVQRDLGPLNPIPARSDQPRKDDRRTSTPQRLGEILPHVPAVSAALARGRETDEPPLPDAPIDDDEAEESEAGHELEVLE